MTESQPLRLALFDCDGTLVDSQHAIIDAMDQTCDAFNCTQQSRQAIRNIVGLPLEVGLSMLFPERTDTDHIQMADHYRTTFRSMRLAGDVDEPLFDGTAEAIKRLHGDDWLLGVATGKAMRGLIPTLESHDLQSYFTTLQTADRARGKPHPEMIEKALSETGVETSHTVMIGDTTYDIEMAVNAKVHSIGVSWGYHDPADLKRAGATCIIDHYSELDDALNHIFGSL